MAKSKKPKTPLERLTYAINAVREYDQISAAEWRSDYPEMARVLESRATGEDSIQSLNRELLTRLSEFIASLYRYRHPKAIAARHHYTTRRFREASARVHHNLATWRGGVTTMSDFYYVRCKGDGSYLAQLGQGKRGDTFMLGTKRALKLKESEANNAGYPSAVYELVPCNPFGGIPFDAKRDSKEGPSNGERAEVGALVVKTHCLGTMPEGLEPYVDGWDKMAEEIHESVDLTEAPDEAVVDLLTNLMHFCHREGISWTDKDGVLLTAVQHFREESGGAIL